MAEKDEAEGTQGKETEEQFTVVTDEDLQARQEEGSEETSGDEERLGREEEDHPDVERKRESRKARKQRQREAKERRERELNFLEKRNEHLERQVSDLAARMDANEGSSLDGRISQLKAAIKKSEDVMAEATSAGRGEDVVEAQRIRDNLRDHLRVAESAKSQRPARGEGAQTEKLDPVVAKNAEQWIKENSWFDPSRADYDSRIAGAIDDSLVAEGYDPRSPDYWEELNERVSEALPHRTAESGSEEEDRGRKTGRGKSRPKSNGRGKGPRFRGSGQEQPLRKGEFYLSQERVNALKEAGVWDDEKLRKKYIQKYREYDREHGHETSYDDAQ